jgi:hypothetical protein
LKRVLLATTVAFALLLTSTSGATAAEPAALDPDIVYALNAVPGGVLVNDSTIQWPSLGMTFTLAPTTARSVGYCPTNYVCAFIGSDMDGNKLAWAGCSTWSTAAFPSGAKSIANARTSGWAYGRNAAGLNVAYAGYGSWTNATGVMSVACFGDGITL